MADKPDDGLPPPLPLEEETAAGEPPEPIEPPQLTDWFELACNLSVGAAGLLFILSAAGVGVGDCDAQDGVDVVIIGVLLVVVLLVGIVEAAIAVIAVRPWRRGLRLGLIAVAAVGISIAAAAVQVAGTGTCD